MPAKKRGRTAAAAQGHPGGGGDGDAPFVPGEAAGWCNIAEIRCEDPAERPGADPGASHLSAVPVQAGWYNILEAQGQSLQHLQQCLQEKAKAADALACLADLKHAVGLAPSVENCQLQREVVRLVSALEATRYQLSLLEEKSQVMERRLSEELTQSREGASKLQQRIDGMEKEKCPCPKCPSPNSLCDCDSEADLSRMPAPMPRVLAIDKIRRHVLTYCTDSDVFSLFRTQSAWGLPRSPQKRGPGRSWRERGRCKEAGPGRGVPQLPFELCEDFWKARMMFQLGTEQATHLRCCMTSLSGPLGWVAYPHGYKCQWYELAQAYALCGPRVRDQKFLSSLQGRLRVVLANVKSIHSNIGKNIRSGRFESSGPQPEMPNPKLKCSTAVCNLIQGLFLLKELVKKGETAVGQFCLQGYDLFGTDHEMFWKNHWLRAMGSVPQEAGEGEEPREGAPSP